ncbi:methylated-DNA--[protein]-cysteine S-methyltransferase [Aquabacterium sp. OR-4]|uniref:methylated-DNA--[protein]-cysteine S-methyltransferase n=1 Tax=Aquabacterium sp. OR-4 TaxID=2978127 RepID=UPI0021B32C1E|nr:methylated-DNA--[protein]-cysteine S-methyltransferase [Aquabacterium sp. OR-4]MDT7834817.1 methylated-DNA--[protein]-cysteine S-methyltransferase [Aquabacterium sp. OR-4]
MTPHPKIEAQTRIASPLGLLLATATAHGLAGLWFDAQQHHPGTLNVPDTPHHPHLQAAAQALALYFDGQPPPAVALDLHGTPFQCAVWQALLAIGHGRTSTYAEVAASVGRPAAVRAAGAAIGRNPVGILVPCHRVLGRDGSLTGYAGGLQRKQALLQLEGAQRSILAA